MEWIKIKTEKPPLNTDIVARCENIFGEGYWYTIFDVCDTGSEIHTIESLSKTILNHGFTEWARLD